MRRARLFLCLINCLLFARIGSPAQPLFENSIKKSAHILDSTHRIIFLSGKIESGFIYTDAESLKPLSHSHPLLVQVDASLLRNSQAAWDHCNCYSKTGISLSYIDFNNSSLGKSLGLSAFLEPYIFTTHKLQLSIRGAVGLVWLSNVYDATTNPENLFYSSPISFLLQASVNLSYPISPAVRLTMSARLNHISNGGTRWPNYGINFPTAGLGVEYLIDPVSLKRRPRNTWPHRLKISTNVFAASHPTDPSASAPTVERTLFGFNAGVLKPLTRMDALGVGGEVYYDPLAKVYEQRTGQHYDPWFASVSLQHAFYLGRLFFGQQLAYTVTTLNPNVSSKVYERYFLECRILSNWYGGVSLKAYGDRSDHFALTSGWIL